MKQQEIIDNLLKEAETMEYGKIVVEFKVHQGKISGGEIIEERKKLG